MRNNISIEKVAELFGTNVEGLGEKCRNYYATLNMEYETVEGKEKEDLILDILKKIDSDSQTIGAPERTGVWQRGWEENLKDFRNTKDPSSVVPKFIRPNNVIRYDGEFIKPANNYFERDYAKLLQLYVYHKTLTDDIENVYEFGAGSGFNLVNIMNFNPELNLYGSDFVQSSVDLINELGKHYNANITSEVFDMIVPNYDYEIKPNSCVFTHGALEQLAGSVKNIISFLVHKKPSVCFHIEPTLEFYKEDNLFDYLQIMFHKKRGYSSGYVPYLKKLEKDGKIVIEECRRLYFGSKFMEGYNLVVWRPRP